MVYTFLETMFFQSGTDMQDKHIFKHGKWLHNFWQLIYSVLVVASNDASRSRSSHVLSQMVVRLLKKSWAKSLDSMDATFSKLDQPKLQ